MKKELVLYDNTRISDFRRCPRYFFYRHVLGWTPEIKSAALIFGGAWHVAMEIVWEMALNSDASKSDIADAAYDGFVKDWTRNGMPSPEEMDYEMQKSMLPRTPMRAMEMLIAYIDARWKQFKSGDFELIDIERGFAVPLSPNDPHRYYIGKIDKIVKMNNRNGKIGGIEHKTTTAYKRADYGPKFRSVFLESFSPNSQVYGYEYMLHMTYPGNVAGIWVDGALVHRTEEDFVFVPIEHQMKQLDAWMWDTHNWIDQIEANKTSYLEVAEDDPYMAAFPKNTNSCFDFNVSCPYIDMCRGLPNPKGRDVPAGFHVNKWDPLEHIDLSGVLDAGD